MKIGDVTLDLKGDPAQWSAVLKQAETDSAKSAKSIGQQFAAALSPKNVLGGIATGFGIGGGIAIFQEVGRAMRDVVNIIPDLIERGAAFAETVHDIMLRTGATAESSSAFAATLQFLGVNTDSIGQKLSMLAYRAVETAGRFADLGIATKDSNGNFLNGLQVLEEVRQKYQQLGGGMQGAALAQFLISRGAGELLPYLNLTDEQLKSLNQEWADLGLVMDAAGVEKAREAKLEQALLGNALTGLGVQLETTVAPAITALTGAVVEFIRQNGKQIITFFATVFGYVTGVMGGLLGIDMSGVAASFASHYAAALDALAGSSDDATTSTDSLTGALDQQTAALDREAKKLTDLAKVQEDVFQRNMRNLSAELGKQLAQLDAADQAIANKRRDIELQRQLRDATEALGRAQIAAGTAKPADQLSAQLAVRDAEERLAAARQDIVDEQAKRAETAKRTGLEATRSYVEDVARIESQSTNKKALAATLARRERVLADELAKAKAKGDADEVANLQIKLEAVQTAEAQTQAAARIVAKQDEVAKKKAAIDEEKKALTAASTAALNLSTTETAGAKSALADLAKLQKGYAPGLTKSMQDAQAAGVGAANAIKAAFGGLLDLLAGTENVQRGTTEKGTSFTFSFGRSGGVLGALSSIIAAMTWIISNIPNLQLGAGLFTSPGERTQIENAPNAGGIGVAARGVDLVSNFLDAWHNVAQALFGTPLMPKRAAGGPVAAGQPFFVGERGPEVFIPRVPGIIVPIAPSLPAALTGAAGGIQVHLYLGGRGSREITDWIDERLAAVPVR